MTGPFKPGLMGGVALVAVLASLPGVAEARGGREASLEARVSQLEKIVAQMQGVVSATDAKNQTLAAQNAQLMEQNAAISAQMAQAAQASAATDKRVAAVEARPAPLAEGFRSGNTTIRLGGYLKMVASNSHFSNGSVPTNTLGRDFFLAQTIPTTVGGRSFDTQDFTAKQTRLWLNLSSEVAGHTVKGYLETDFQTTASATQNVTAGGSQKTTNGYTLALRRATLSIDRFTFGQDWTTFQYVAALPETTDYVGGAEGTVFVRQPLIRYSAPLSRDMTLHVGVENPESAFASAVATGTVAAQLESGTDRMPDFTARLVYAGKHGELSLGGLVREVRAESTGSALVNNVASSGAVGNGLTAMGIGASVGGKLFLNTAKSSDIRFIATYGKDIGRYVGLNFAPDAVYNPATNSLTDVDVFAVLAAARIAVAPQVRVNLMGSLQDVSYDKSLTTANLNGLNKQAWSAAANIFYSPVRNIDLGVEYRHGERTTISATNGEAKGQLDRIEFAAKYSF